MTLKVISSTSVVVIALVRYIFSKKYTIDERISPVFILCRLRSKFQKQHLELARDLAERFNSRYSDTFKVPEPLIKSVGAKIMSLQNPGNKMSKSDSDENGYILLLDKPDAVVRKIKRAVTDSIGEVKYRDEQPGIKNLMNIYSIFSGESIESLEVKYEGEGYGKFKDDLAEVVVEGLRPIQRKYDYYIKNKDFLEKIYKEGSEKANYKAMKTLRKVYKKVGFIQP